MDPLRSLLAASSRKNEEHGFTKHDFTPLCFYNAFCGAPLGFSPKGKGGDTDRDDLFAETPPLAAKRMTFMITRCKG